MTARMACWLLFTLLLTSCALSSNPANGLVEGEELALIPPLYSIDPRRIESTGEHRAVDLLGVDVLEFSPDGHFLLAHGSIWVGRSPGRLYEWVQIHDARTGQHKQLVEVRDGKVGVGSGMSASGLLDNNTYFVSGYVEGMQFTRVFDLHSHRELLALNRVYTQLGRGDYLFMHTGYARGLVRNWRTDEEAEADHFPFTPPHLTPGGALLSKSPRGWIVWHQPNEGEAVLLRSGIPLVYPMTTHSERYLVGTGKGERCTVWRLPEAERVGRCKRNVFQRLSFNKAYAGAAAAHPEREQIALSWGSQVKVYDLEPFRLIKTLEAPAAVTDLAFQDDRLLVFTGETLQIWPLDQDQPVKQLALRLGGRHVVSPDGNLLAVFREGINELTPEASRGRIDVYDLSQW